MLKRHARVPCDYSRGANGYEPQTECALVQGSVGSDPILDEDTGPFQRVAWLTSGTLVGLTQFPDLNSTQPFNERRPGLDHLAFGCANRDELKSWEIRLNELGITNGGIVDVPSYSALSFRDPDNIALEFFAPRG